jgi:lipid-binding SYLF domain-containing protein
MNSLRKSKLFLLIIAFGLLAPMISFAETRTELVVQIERAQEYLADIMKAPDTAIPETLMRKCHGVIILRQYKAGFVFGVKGGSGVVLVKDETTGQWSPPAFIKTGEGSFGLQIGGQSIDSIFLIMNQDGMEMLNKTKFKIGVDASASVGPVGRDAEAKISPGTAILAYSRAKGLYAGAAFEGGILLNNNTANEKFYNVKNITLQDIVFERKVDMPVEAKPLVGLLKSYSSAVEKK